MFQNVEYILLLERCTCLAKSRSYMFIKINYSRPHTPHFCHTIKLLPDLSCFTAVVPFALAFLFLRFFYYCLLSFFSFGIFNLMYTVTSVVYVLVPFDRSYLLVGISVV